MSRRKSRLMLSAAAICICILMVQIHAFPHLDIGEKEDKIEIQEIVDPGSRHRRSSRGFPDKLDITFPSNGFPVYLHLVRELDLNDEVPVLLSRQATIQRHLYGDTEPVGYYYDMVNGSSFMIWHSRAETGSGLGYTYFGMFSVLDNQYVIQPSVSDNIHHTVAKLPVKQVVFDDSIDGEDEQTQFSSRSTNTKRRKRETTIAYEVEIMFVLDFALYSYWYDRSPGATTVERSETAINTLRQFYAFVLNSINLRYHSVAGRGYTITCIYAGIYIAETAAAAPFVENHFHNASATPATVLGYDILPDFRDWANANLASLIDYDHAMLFTRYNLGKLEDGVFTDSLAGLAYVSQLCKTGRYSINEDDFITTFSKTGAHELGHSLGADHDGTGNTCTEDSGHVMNPVSGVYEDINRNRLGWVFSSCSQDDFDIYIDELNTADENCMTYRSSNYNSSANDVYVNDIAGDEYNPDEQCRHSIGDERSYMHRGYFDGDYSTFCAYMPCMLPGAEYFRHQLAWDGTTCGNGKLCEKGYCVPSSKAPSVSDETCMFGDVPDVLSTDNETCEVDAKPANSSYRCYSAWFKHRCCYSCGIHKQNNAHIPDCEYGDRSSQCDSTICSLYTDEDRTTTCCSSCDSTTSTTTTTTALTQTTTTTTTSSTTTTTPITSTTTTTTPTTLTTTTTTIATTPATTKASAERNGTANRDISCNLSFLLALIVCLS